MRSEQLAPQAAKVVNRYAWKRIDQASHQLDYQRLLHRLASLERPHLERDLGIDSRGLSR